MRIRARPALTLLEIAIAFGLVAIISYTLFSTFTHSSKLLHQIEVARPALLQRKEVYEKLTRLFTQAEAKSFTITAQKNKPSPILEFIFDNGAQRQSQYAGKQQASLSIDKKHQLIFQIFPHEESADSAQKQKTAPPVKEILFTDVKKVEFDLEKTPSILYLSITQKDRKEPLHYAFLLTRNSDSGWAIPKDKEDS